MHDACVLLNFFDIKIAGMRCSLRHLKTSHRADAPPEITSAISSVGISNLFPELLTIIFSYLEVRDKGSAAQVNDVTVDVVCIRAQASVCIIHLQKYLNGLHVDFVVLPGQ